MPYCPPIVTPCPLPLQLGDARTSFCERCNKHVHDLDRMGEAQRMTLLADAREEVCVRYRRPIGRAALAAAALVASGLGLVSPAAAQDTPVAAPQESPGDIVVGGARRLTRAEQVQLRREAKRQERLERAEAGRPKAPEHSTARATAR